MILVGGYLEQITDLQATGKHFTATGNRYLLLLQQRPRFNQQFALDQIKRMTEAYRERWLKSVALTGNFSDDPILRPDIAVCSKIISQ